MSEPRQDVADRLDRVSINDRGARDHDHRQAEPTGGIDLRARACAAGIARHDMRDRSCTQQIEIALFGEGAARDDDVGVRQRQRCMRFVDDAQNVAVLASGSEWRQMLTPDGEKDPAGGVGEGIGCGTEVGHDSPAVAGDSVPRRPHERDERQICRSAGCDRVAAHGIGKWMRGIDDVGNARLVQIVSKPFGTTEATGADGQWLIDRHLGPACVRVDRIKACAGHRFGQGICIARSAQNEDARHA